MLRKHNIELPRGITAGLSEAQFEKMADVALILHPLWENALGKNWREIMTRQKILDLYHQM